MVVAEDHRPVGHGQEARGDRAGGGRAGGAGGAPPAVDVGAGVGRVAEEAHDGAEGGRLPDQRPVALARRLPRGKGQTLRLERAHHGPPDAEPPEGGEEVGQALAHLRVRVQLPAAVGPPDVPHRQGEPEEALAGLVPAALVQAQAQREQLRLGERPLHAQQEAVVRVAGVVDGRLVGEEGPGEAAELDQPVPVAVVAGQARGLQHEHQPHLPQAHLRDEPLEARPVRGGAAGAPLVLVDDLDGAGRPAERHGAPPQGVLALGALLVLPHLEVSRLAHVHAGQPLAVRALDGRWDHGRPPLLRRRRRPGTSATPRRPRPQAAPRAPPRATPDTPGAVAAPAGTGGPPAAWRPAGRRLRWPARIVSAPHLNGYDTFTGLHRDPAPPQAAAGELSEEVEHPPLLPRARYLGRATGRRTEPAPARRPGTTRPPPGDRAVRPPPGPPAPADPWRPKGRRRPPRHGRAPAPTARRRARRRDRPAPTGRGAGCPPPLR